MTKEEIGAILKKSRIASGKTQKEVAEIIGRNQQIIGHWETGYSQPDANTLFTLCDIYGTTVDNAFGFNKSTVSVEDLNFIKKYNELDQYGKETIDMALERELGRVEELQKKNDLISQLESSSAGFGENSNFPARIIRYFQSVSAGTGQVIFDDVSFDRITIPDIPEYRRVAYAVKVSGHSMEPLYKDDDMLLIEPTCTIDVGEIGIFNVDGQAYVKKLGEGELISLNIGYGNIKLTDDSRCMGRVVDKIQKI